MAHGRLLEQIATKGDFEVAIRRSKDSSDADSDSAPKLGEALRNVRATRETDEPSIPTTGIQTDEEIADRLGGALSVADVTSGKDADDDAADALGAPSVEGLRDRLAHSDPFADADAEDASGPSDAGRGFSKDMVSETVQTFPSAPIATTTGDGEVTNVSAGDPKETREALRDLPIIGDTIDRALTSTEQAGGGHATAIDEAADSDPTTTPAGGSEGSAGTGSDGAGGAGGAAGGGEAGGGGGGGTTEIENEDGSHSTVYDNGDIVTTYPDGTVEHNYADGGTETDYPDGTVKTENPDGSSETIHPDGTIETVNADGTTETVNADGTVENGVVEEEPPPSDSGEDDEEATDEPAPEGEGTDGAGSGTEIPIDQEGELPDDIKEQIAADLAHTRAQLRPVDPGDGVTDPGDDDVTPVSGLTGPVDAHRELKDLLVQPGHGPAFGEGAAGGGPGVPGVPDPQSGAGGAVDPGPDADTPVQTRGPEERDTTHDVAGLTSPPRATEDADDDAGDDASVSLHLSPISPVHSRLLDEDLTLHTSTDDPEDDGD